MHLHRRARPRHVLRHQPKATGVPLGLKSCRLRLAATQLSQFRTRHSGYAGFAPSDWFDSGGGPFRLQSTPVRSGLAVRPDRVLKLPSVHPVRMWPAADPGGRRAVMATEQHVLHSLHVGSPNRKLFSRVHSQDGDGSRSGGGPIPRIRGNRRTTGGQEERVRPSAGGVPMPSESRSGVVRVSVDSPCLPIP